jgi:uncharacterized Zn-finger protein
VCNKSFNHQTHLKKHQRIHSRQQVISKD